MESTVFGIPVLTCLIFLGIPLVLVAILSLWGITYTSSEYESKEH